MRLKKIINLIDSVRKYDLFEKPLFILSPPRSGSTLLYELLLLCPETLGHEVETDNIWRNIYPADRSVEINDFIGGDEFSTEKEKRIKRLLYRQAVWSQETKGKIQLLHYLGVKRIRYIEKTISNCFHTQLLKKIFPDALYIFLIRDPKATLSSMFDGWKGSKRNFLSQSHCPSKEMFNSGLFPYPLAPEWSIYMKNEKEHRAFAWAWKQYVDYSLSFVDTLASSQYRIIKYEDLISSPQRIVSDIYSFAGYSFNKHIEHSLNHLPLSRTTLTKPDNEKWKRKYDIINQCKDIYKNYELMFNY